MASGGFGSINKSIAMLSLCGLMLIAIIYWFVGYIEPKPTPLQGFTAPFVFGNFRVPVDNPLTQEAVQLERRHLELAPVCNLSGRNL